MDEKKPRRRWISKLKAGEQVVCRVYVYNLDRIKEWKCHFVANYPERRQIMVTWLDGWRSDGDFVDYEDVLAVFDPDGPVMEFDNGSLRGPSALLIRR